MEHTPIIQADGIPLFVHQESAVAWSSAKVCWTTSLLTAWSTTFSTLWAAWSTTRSMSSAAWSMCSWSILRCSWRFWSVVSKYVLGGDLDARITFSLTLSFETITWTSTRLNSIRQKFVFKTSVTFVCKYVKKIELWNVDQNANSKHTFTDSRNKLFWDNVSILDDAIDFECDF